MDLSDSPGRPACPSRASGWSSLTTPWGLPCCARFPCVHAVATTPAQRLGPASLTSPQSCQPSPIWQSGRPVHRHFRGLLGVHSRYGLHTRAVTVYRDTLTEGFSHFVASMTAPVASGWSGCRVGLTPTGKRRLATAHAMSCRRQPVPSAAGSNENQMAIGLPATLWRAEMRQRAFIAGLESVAAWPLAVRAQQLAKPVIGVLVDGDWAPRHRAAFIRGLAETGHIEGRDFAIDHRTGVAERLREAAEDLGAAERRGLRRVFLAANQS
jgi:hypothetical protein